MHTHTDAQPVTRLYLALWKHHGQHAFHLEVIEFLVLPFLEFMVLLQSTIHRISAVLWIKRFRASKSH